MAGIGGAQPGAGRKPGKANADTIARMAAKRRLVERTIAASDKLFNAQLDKAIGEKFLMVKVTEYAMKKNGERGAVKRVYTETVTDQNLIMRFLDGEMEESDEIPLNEEGSQVADRDEWYFMSTKSADNLAISNMLDRAYGKPTEKVDIGTGESDLSDLDDEELERRVNERIDAYLTRRKG